MSRDLLGVFLCFGLFFLSIFIHLKNFFSKDNTYLLRKNMPSWWLGHHCHLEKKALFSNLLSAMLRCISNFFLKAQPLICPPALTAASETCRTDCSEETPCF